MRGRFEKPRQSRFSRSQQPQQPQRPQRPNSAGDPGRYPPEGYQSYGQDPRQAYQEDSGTYGYETGYEAGYQNEYGVSPDPRNSYSGGYYGNQYPEDPRAPRQKGSIGWAILGFFIPLVGLILFLSWKNKKPGDARSAGKGALIGFITGLVALILVVTIGFFAGKSFLNGMLDKVNKVEVNVEYTQDPNAPTETDYTWETETAEPTTAATTEPPHVASPDDYINFLVVGQAARAGEEERFADTMMLVTLNTYEKKMVVTSMLRDTLVHPPAFRGHTFGQIKLTTVYHLGSHYDNGNVAGSMELINLTLFNNFGVEVDHNFEISFEVFESIINTMHGIDIELNEVEAAYMNKATELATWADYHFEPGKTSMDGYSALAYARMRKAEGDADSDIKRTARQQKVVQAILAKVRTMSVADIQKLADAILPMITTSMSNEQIIDTMKLLIPMLPELTLESGGTCPANYHGALVDIYGDGMQHSVLRFNVKETSEFMRERTLGIKPGTE